MWAFSGHLLLLPVSVGSVHVHNPGTIIFSLLSQFTGQVGPTIETGTTAETGGRCDDRDGLVFQPAPSPRIHISEEERSEETDSIFFPSQEQGKDCHVSKEEALWCIIKLKNETLTVTIAGRQEGRKEGSEQKGNTTLTLISVWQTVNHRIQKRYLTCRFWRKKTCLCSTETSQKTDCKTVSL